MEYKDPEQLQREILELQTWKRHQEAFEAAQAASRREPPEESNGTGLAVAFGVFLLIAFLIGNDIIPLNKLDKIFPPPSGVPTSEQSAAFESKKEHEEDSEHSKEAMAEAVSTAGEEASKEMSKKVDPLHAVVVPATPVPRAKM
ncbi:MAG: hypothetical protein ACAI37_22700, partial [Chthoniobacter sp.]